MATTYQIFADFPDHRVTARCIYSISDLLTISLLTYLCGGEDYVDMSEFAHVRARDFNLLTDNDTSPSPDTFERLMPAVCPEELRRCLSEHGRSFLSSLGEKRVAIDGKKLRGASPRANGTRGDYILGAYVTENHLLVGQESVTDKENEIPAVALSAHIQFCKCGICAMPESRTPTTGYCTPSRGSLMAISSAY